MRESKMGGGMQRECVVVVMVPGRKGEVGMDADAREVQKPVRATRANAFYYEISALVLFSPMIRSPTARFSYLTGSCCGITFPSGKASLSTQKKVMLLCHTIIPFTPTRFNHFKKDDTYLTSTIYSTSYSAPQCPTHPP